MIHPHQLIGISLVLAGLGMLINCLCLQRMATIIQRYFLTNRGGLEMSPKLISYPPSFIKNQLSTWLVEAALNRLEEIEAPEDIIDLIILYSWAFVKCSETQPGPDNCPELVNESLIALEKSGWKH